MRNITTIIILEKIHQLLRITKTKFLKLKENHIMYTLESQWRP